MTTKLPLGLQASRLCYMVMFLLSHQLALLQAVSEGQILMGFRSFIVDDQNALSNWQETISINTHPCTWTGVACTLDGYVTEIEYCLMVGQRVPRRPRTFGVDLSSMSLTSKSNLHMPLCQLPNLTSLELQENQFSGPLPPELDRCTNLQYLNLGANNFSGPIKIIPHNLRYLNLSLNSFSGQTIAPTLGLLQNLQVLDLAATGFTGALIPELGQLVNLQHLVMSWNPFSPEVTLPDSLQRMQQLEYFECAGCGLHGPLPPWLGTLQKLQYLDLSNNQISGVIPVSMMALPKLKWLELYKNNLTGPIPVEIGNLVLLTDLDLSDNRLTGVIPEELIRLQDLAVVHLQNNSLEGPIPEGIVHLTKLYDLKLYMNKLNGRIPIGLGKNSPLLQFDVSNNHMHGQIPSNLCAHGVLWRLILFNNSFAGAFPYQYGTCTSLIRIRLFNNHLSGPIAPSLWSLPNLTLLEIHDNNFSGTIPSTIAKATNLSSLKLHNNEFSGQLPSELGQLTNLERLHAHHNKFSGEIPSALGQLGASLTSLWLDANAFTGNLPEELGKLGNLVSLGLSFNFLRGSIPAQIGNLENLVFLDVSHNLLSGDLAKAVQSFDMNRFVVFNCSYNEFSGRVEALRTEWFVGNPALCFGDSSQVMANLDKCGGMKDHSSNNVKTRDFFCILGVLGSVFLTALALWVLTLWRMGKKKKKVGVLSKGGSERKSLTPWKITLFHQLNITYKELIECLDEGNVIGSGGGGEVYKATLRNGQEVAIKKLWEAGKGMDLHDHGFKAEVESLGAIRHRNIVKLLCCCSNFSTNLLVYEYMPNGSLGDLLHDSKDKALCDWNLRSKIAIGAAQGLTYLHHDCVPQILHRDIKSNNILLDNEYEAHIADFGLAKCLNDISMSIVAGSYGYIAPEYAYTLNVNEKSDVFSFGVVLLELVTGKQPIATEFGDAMTIVTWIAKKIHEHGENIVLEFLDKKIIDLNFYMPQMLKVFHIANCCTQHLPKDRPTMRKITQMLIASQKIGLECGGEMSMTFEVQVAMPKPKHQQKKIVPFVGR